MVLRRIEIDHFVARTALDDDVAQRFAPQRGGTRMHGIEIQLRHLGDAVETGILSADRRQPDGYRKRFGVRRKGQHGLFVAQQPHVGERLRKTGGEKDILVGHPPLRAAHPGDLIGRRRPQFAHVDPLLGDRVHQVDDHLPRPLARKGIAVHARTGRRRKLHPDIFTG